MAALALASSISPGPVNIVALGSGARYGLMASMQHVTGATVGFSALLLLTGLGMHELLATWPALTDGIKWAGAGFLLFMAYRLAHDSGELESDESARRPSLAYGAAMQWLNPKAWLAAVAGTGTYASHGDGAAVWQFTGVYFVICYVSIACWAWAGAFLQKYLRDARRVRAFNLAMAAIIAASVMFLIAS